MTTPPESLMLRSYLDAQRRHVLGILEGLDDEALVRPVLPSGWSCAGMLQHLALDVERFWFRCVISGEPEAIDSLGCGGRVARRRRRSAHDAAGALPRRGPPSRRGTRLR